MKKYLKKMKGVIIFYVFIALLSFICSQRLNNLYDTDNTNHIVASEIELVNM